MEKEPTIENKITIFEFEKWLDNCVRDAEAKGLSREDIILVFTEKTHEVFAKKLAKIDGGIKNPEMEKMNIFEFKRWIDNCIIDAEARGLEKYDIALAFLEKSHEILETLKKSEKE